MVSFLYAVVAFTCALIVMVLPLRTRKNLLKEQRQDRAFINLIKWTALFCISDGIWGVTASDVVSNDTLLTINSYIFHLLASFTPLIWLQFILTYIGEVKNRKIYYTISMILFDLEIILLASNFFTHNVFSIGADGAYRSGSARQFLFYAQYANYVTIAILALYNIAKKKNESPDYMAILTFVTAPIASGIFQLLYPNAPAYSIGYMLGFCVIYSFVITGMLESRIYENIRISSADKAKTTFLNNMSHDIRTPMNAISGFNSIALASIGDDEKVKDCLNKIGKASDALLTIINDILEISRIEAGKVTISEDRCNIESSFADIEAMVRELARTAGIELSFSYGKIDDKYVTCDIAHCGRVFTNLITNAIKYTPEGGHVHVHCEQTGRRDDGYGIYTYTFRDDGIGMSESFQKQLFQAFSREQTSTVSKIQGTGLGLALSKNLVELMGGTISCSSKQGGGSTFTVVLPFKILEEQFSESDDSTDGQPVTLDGSNILLVEDNDMNREIANVILSEMGANVIEAADGSDAIEMMKGADADRFDLILMDVQMPVVDGYEATRRIRALGTRASQIPIIAMTANAFEEDRKTAIAAGMDGHIAKPIDIDALTATLKRFLH